MDHSCVIHMTISWIKFPFKFVRVWNARKTARHINWSAFSLSFSRDFSLVRTLVANSTVLSHYNSNVRKQIFQIIISLTFVNARIYPGTYIVLNSLKKILYFYTNFVMMLWNPTLLNIKGVIVTQFLKLKITFCNS